MSLSKDGKIIFVSYHRECDIPVYNRYVFWNRDGIVVTYDGQCFVT